MFSRADILILKIGFLDVTLDEVITIGDSGERWYESHAGVKKFFSL